MSNGTPQTPEQVLDALAAAVRPFVDNEIPNTAAWNVNPGIQVQSLRDIGGFFTDVWNTLNALTAPTGQWVPGAAPTYATATTFTVPGDQRTIMPIGTRLRVHLGVPTTVVAVAGLAFDGAITTVTVDQPILTTALSGVDYGFVRQSVPKIGAADLQSVAVGTAAIADGAVTNAKVTGPIDYAKLSGTPPVLWTLTAGELVPSDPTTYVSVGGRAAARARYQENGAVSGVFGSYANIKWAAGALTKDVSTWPSWLLQFDLPADKLTVSRAPASSVTFTDLLAFSLAEFALSTRMVSAGAGTIRGRFGDANTGNAGDWQVRVNANFTNQALDDTTKPSWTLRMDPTNDAFVVYRAPATTGAAAYAALLTCSSAGNLTVPAVVQGNTGVRSGTTADGNCFLNPGTAGASGNPGYVAFYQAGTRKGYIGWTDGANRLMMVGTDGGGLGFHMSGNNICDGFFDHVGRGCFMAGPGNQVITAGAGATTIAINTSTYTDTSGMAFPQYNQIITPAGRWWVLFTLRVEQSGSSSSMMIQQWNGNAWVTRYSTSAPAAGQFATFNNLSGICDSNYGTQFQFAIQNNAGSGTITLINVQVCAVIIGKSG